MTRTLPLLLTLGAALALSACSKSPEQPAAQPTGSEATEPARSSSAPAVEVSEAPLTPAASSEPSSTTTATETITATTIPASIRGRWGMVPKDCTSKLGDAKGLLTISAGQLKFYEAVATIGKVKEADDNRIRATFRYSGEGQTWTQDVVLGVQDGGKTLIRRDYGPDALPGPQKYTRCG